MRPLIFLTFIFLLGAAAPALAEGIHAIERGSAGEPHLVKYESGRVEFVDGQDVVRLNELEANLSIGETSQTPNFKMLHPENDFTPTPVPDSKLGEIFQRFNPYMRRRSECSDRAHVWAWDEFKRSGTRSEKAFLFLTDAYIRRHRYKWWFHVAPMFTTVTGGKIVMDYQFIDRPVSFTQWKNMLVFSKRDCVRDFQFKDYNAGADQSQDCYVKFEPMYYYVPGEIGAREDGNPKTGWSEFQVNASRSRAFFKGSNE